MPHPILTDQQIDALIELARRAGEAIMEIYSRDFHIEDKADNSPLTEADLASHRTIAAGLKALTPGIPLLSEESGEQAFAERIGWTRYWLIDPLDGTKEFIKRNGEFTVNIALIDNHRPVFGVVHAPAIETCYWGGDGIGAFCQRNRLPPEAIRPAPLPADNKGWRVVGSRSHQTEEFRTFTQALENPEIVPMGSSLKLCLVAEGKADLYPRLGPTSEWDTAAAQAVVEAAGAQVLTYPELTPMRYNTRKETLLNPHFVVCPEPHPCWARC